jgi:hypothetical protein
VEIFLNNPWIIVTELYNSENANSLIALISSQNLSLLCPSKRLYKFPSNGTMIAHHDRSFFLIEIIQSQNFLLFIKTMWNSFLSKRNILWSVSSIEVSFSHLF